MSADTKHPTEGTHDNLALLKGHSTLGEILETAMRFERTAKDFYTALTRRVSKPIRTLAEELAEEEKRHYELFKELAEREDIHARVADAVRTPPSDHRFSDFIQSPVLCDFPDEQSILQYALAREQAAMEQYQSLAADGEVPTAARDLFRYLAHEELLHKGELEKRYYELVYTTNV